MCISFPLFSCWCEHCETLNMHWTNYWMFKQLKQTSKLNFGQALSKLGCPIIQIYVYPGNCFWYIHLLKIENRVSKLKHRFSNVQVLEFKVNIYSFIQEMTHFVYFSLKMYELLQVMTTYHSINRLSSMFILTPLLLPLIHLVVSFRSSCEPQTSL